VLVALLVALTGCSTRGEPSHATKGCPSTADPAGLACRITSAARTSHDPDASANQLANAGRLAENGYQLLGDHPEWDTAVLAAVDPSLREQVRRAVDAYRQLLSLSGPPGANLPAWRVVDPLPVDVLRGLYDRAQRRFGVDWTVLAAVNLVETRMGRVVGLSSAGAQGPMQFMPATWAAYGLGGDVWDPRDAIMGAANYLASNGGADPARLDRALHRYNNDVRYVRAVRDYAAMLSADPNVLVQLHAWPVEYRTVAGDIPLPTGYESAHPIPVGQWLTVHPLPQGEG
jgi:membrane-bound lytic murein transglycosylase B